MNLPAQVGPPALLQLSALDDNLISNILEHCAGGCEAVRLSTLAAICCVSQSWRQTFDARDALWDLMRRQLEGNSVLPARAASSPPARRSKRTKSTGKQAFVRAVAARAQRSDALVILLSTQLQRGSLTAAKMRKAIEERQPININRPDLSGFTVMHLSLAYAPRHWFALVKELLQNYHACADVCDLDGMTPLMVAAANGNVRALKLLIEHDAAANGGLLRRGKHAEGWRRTPAISAEDFGVANPMARRFGGEHTARQWAHLYGPRKAIAFLDDVAPTVLRSDVELAEFRQVEIVHLDAFETACTMWKAWPTIGVQQPST